MHCCIMPGTNGTQLRVLIVDFGAGDTQSVRRGLWQTLLVAVVCGESAGFASPLCCHTQGRLA